MNDRFTAVLFDMDGTLLDSMATGLDTYVAAVSALGGPVCSPNDVLGHFSAGSTEAVLAALLGRPAGAEALDCFYRCLEERLDRVATYPGVPEALAVLRPDLQLGVVTGATQRTANTLLRAAGLRDYFEVLIGGDDVPKPKPAPDGLLLACARLSVPPTRCAYVGDAALDHGAAVAAGLVPIAAAWGHLHDEDTACELRFPTPADLVAYLSPAASMAWED